MYRSNNIIYLYVYSNLIKRESPPRLIVCVLKLDKKGRQRLIVCVLKLDCKKGQQNLIYSDRTSGNLYNDQWTDPQEK